MLGIYFMAASVHLAYASNYEDIYVPQYKSASNIYGISIDNNYVFKYILSITSILYFSAGVCLWVGYLGYGKACAIISTCLSLLSYDNPFLKEGEFMLKKMYTAFIEIAILVTMVSLSSEPTQKSKKE